MRFAYNLRIVLPAPPHCVQGLIQRFPPQRQKTERFMSRPEGCISIHGWGFLRAQCLSSVQAHGDRLDCGCGFGTVPGGTTGSTRALSSGRTVESLRQHLAGSLRQD